MGTEQSSRSPRSLADDLRGRSAGEIRRLLTVRPDLLNPWPTDISQLARRAADDASVLEALGCLDTPALRVLEVFAALHEATAEQIAQALPEEETSDAIEDLWDRALLWGGPAFKIVRAAQQAFGAFPCGLSAAGHLTPDPQAVAEAASDLDPDRLRYLVWEHPVSTTANALTVLRSEQNVVPREVALLLRKGLFLPAVQAPSLAAPPEPAAATGVWNVLAGLRYLLADLAREPLTWNAARGVSRRALADRATVMAVPVDDLAVWLELGAAAGLIGVLETTAHPTADAQAWLASHPSQMWRALMDAWLDSDRPLGACRPEGLGCLTRNGVARLAAHRRQILSVWPSATVNVEEMREVLVYRRPRLVQAWEQVADVFHELTALGLLVAGVPTAHVNSPADTTIPEPDSTIIVQPDLTVISGANVDTDTWDMLSAVAKVESWGPVIMMRIDQARLRTAVLHREPSQILQQLARQSRTPLPQSLEYLVTDAVRGAPAHLTEVTLVRVSPEDADPLRALGWEELAPRTFVTDLPTEAVRRILADNGIAATGEDSSVMGLPLDYPRVVAHDADAVDRLVVHLVEAPEGAGGPAPQLEPADPATLRDVLRAPRVWLEFSEGAETLTHLVEPLEVRSGLLTGWSLTAARTVCVPLSRIAAVRIAE